MNSKSILIGSSIGCCIGSILAPIHMATAISAPISYPLLPVLSVVLKPDLEPSTKALLAPAAFIFGVSQIPLAPLHFCITPTYPFVGAVVGGLIGAILGNKKG